jgi:hypothetical protein
MTPLKYEFTSVLFFLLSWQQRMRFIDYIGDVSVRMCISMIDYFFEAASVAILEL